MEYDKGFFDTLQVLFKAKDIDAIKRHVTPETALIKDDCNCNFMWYFFVYGWDNIELLHYFLDCGEVVTQPLDSYWSLQKALIRGMFQVFYELLFRLKIDVNYVHLGYTSLDDIRRRYGGSIWQQKILLDVGARYVREPPEDWAQTFLAQREQSRMNAVLILGFKQCGSKVLGANGRDVLRMIGRCIWSIRGHCHWDTAKRNKK